MIPFTVLDDFIEVGPVVPRLCLTGADGRSPMVEHALHSMERTTSHHARCETEPELPDAVQLLTPCTRGNGRLHVLSPGCFAMTLFHRQNGKGVRVYLDLAKTVGRPRIRRWALCIMERRRARAGPSGARHTQDGHIHSLGLARAAALRASGKRRSRPHDRLRKLQSPSSGSFLSAGQGQLGKVSPCSLPARFAALRQQSHRYSLMRELAENERNLAKRRNFF